MSFISEQLEAQIGRRALLKWSSVATASLLGGGILAGCGGNDNNSGSSNGSNVDDAVLRFALNLEYLEAEFYSYAATGAGNPDNVGANPGTVTVKPNFTTNVTGAILEYANEINVDERHHVQFLRSALGAKAVDRPAIDLFNSFNAAYAAASNTPGATFDPFASNLNFLLGAFIFEDVGVTAYKGAARLLKNKDYLEAAAGILAVEAYHAGAIRALLLQPSNSAGVSIANAISDLRDGADGPADLDQGVTISGQSNLVPTGSNSIAFGRNTSQVLNIVYLGASATSGGFFPAGLNGDIKTVVAGDLSYNGGIS